MVAIEQTARGKHGQRKPLKVARLELPQVRSCRFSNILNECSLSCWNVQEALTRPFNRCLPVKCRLAKR